MNKQLLHTVFEHTAEVFPHNIAVSQGTRACTYAALNAASTKMALCLHALGVEKETIVGVALESSIAYVATIIGVMKAGGVFLPIDPASPDARLSYMMQKTVPQIMVTGISSTCAADDIVHRMQAWQAQPPVIRINEDLDVTLADGNMPALSDESVVRIEAIPDPNDSNYIMYTSGSTGNPKAIVGRHRSLSHFMHWETQEFELDQTVKVAQLAPVTFDASLRDIFVPLICGGSVCIPASETRKNVSTLIHWLNDSGITLLHCVPSLFRLITKELEQQPHPQEMLTDLKYILMAGEALYGRDLARWMDLMGNATELVNFYGPSETTLIKSFFRSKTRPENLHAMLPVGFPIANTAILIIKGQRLCSIGEIGEIYIKTPFRTKGYYGDPALTDTVFVQNPVNPEQEDIVYKTGDLGRYLPDRCIEFIGRMDTQVKVNGIRIELSEIEATLLGCGFIDQTVVLAQSNPEGENTLVCYYSLKKPANPDDIRSYLRQQLPAYMHPAFYVEMDTFPLNINGKIDKRALPKPEDLIYQHTTYDPPTNGTEEKLCQIWMDVLGLQKVGINSPFFEIGGHSLKATRVISQINRELGVEISLKAFFENDTVRALSESIRHHDPSTVDPIPALDVQSVYRLSPMQRRLWIIDQIDAGCAAYNMPALYAIEGHLQLPAFRQAFADLVARHEALRTRIVTVQGEPQLNILDRTIALNRLQIDVIDLSTRTEAEEMARAYAEEDAAKAFDLSQWPLFRIKLFQLAEQRYALYFNSHHIICDAWSLDTLSKELAAFYRAHLTGETPSLVPLRIQYKDYAAWQYEQVDTASFQTSKAYWLDQLSGNLVPLQLPTDYPRPPVSQHRGATHSFAFDPETTAALSRLGQQHHASMFVVLAALLKVLLYRYTNQNDIIIGTPVAGRNHADLEHLVGLFVNTLPLRDSITGDDTFAAVLASIKQTTLAAYDHQLYPFDLLVDALHLPRDLSRSPLFDVMLILQETALPSETRDLKLVDLHLANQTSRFDLAFEVTPLDSQMHIDIHYDIDLFKPDTIQRMAGHFEELANSASTSSATPLRDLSLLPAAERNTLTVLLNQTEKDFPDNRTLPQLFYEQVVRTPDQLALIAGEKQLTYRQLQEQTCQLATCLINEQGVKPDEIIGLMAEPSCEWIVGILAIMMSGAAYLPIEPSSPQQRARFMLRDAACRRLLTQQKFMQKASQLVSEEILCIATDEHAERMTDSFHLPGTASPDNLAYVIYTSGSTGKPKGVMIEHRGFVNMITDQIRLFDITASDRVLQFSACSFDASLSEIFMALLSGATLVIADDDTIHDPVSFIQYCNDQKVSVATLPPSYLNALAHRPLPTLRTLITAGEPPIVDDALFYAKHKTYINAYGPTEVSVCASVHKVSPGERDAHTIAIGKPIANTRIYILDEASNLLPVGIPGEICISGVGLARGYINQPKLTQEKFIPHPFRPGERLYRTGDLGMWRADECLTFLGRRDDQIKLRGYRIELEEIRHTLQRYPAVNDAVVTLLGEKSERLVAYVVAQQEIDGTELKTFLAQHLPGYMVPEAVFCLSALPLTPHGKIDRKALPHPATLQPTAADYTAPRNQLETQLVGIWQDVLGKRVGVTDNFFNEGGNSLQAIQLISKICMTYNVHISVRELYLKPTIAALVAALQTTPIPAVPSPLASVDAHQITSDLQTIKRSPLTELAATGELAPVDAAALIYLPDVLLQLSAADRDTIVQEWFRERPVLSSITESAFGRIGQIMLPMFTYDLYDNQRALQRLILQALEMAAGLGARSVSLTGLLPSVTDHGRMITPAIPPSQTLPAITCGYATTGAAMLLTVERILAESQRRLGDERVALVGLSPLGTTALTLMLNVLSHPSSIVLFDVFKRDTTVEELRDRLVDDGGFQGSLHVLETGTAVPDQVYDASLILATSHVSGLLDVPRLKAGTLVVQASGQDCVLREPAINRWRATADIMFTEADLLHAPSALTSTVYIPFAIEHMLRKAKLEGFLKHKAFAITGCVLAGLLHACYIHPATAMDAADLGTCLEHYRTLKALGFKSAGLHLGDYILSQADIASFQNNYGNPDMTSVPRVDG